MIKEVKELWRGERYIKWDRMIIVILLSPIWIPLTIIMLSFAIALLSIKNILR